MTRLTDEQALRLESLGADDFAEAAAALRQLLAERREWARDREKMTEIISNLAKTCSSLIEALRGFVRQPAEGRDEGEIALDLLAAVRELDEIAGR